MSSGELPQVKEKVFHKENVLEQSLQLLDTVRGTIQSCVHGTKGPISDAEVLRTWLGLQKQLVDDVKNCEVLIVVAGDTGLGKTSALNALVTDFQTILPSSQSKACTAAVCVIKYHDEPAVGKQYRAVIRFKSLQDAKDELVEFFHEWDGFLGNKAWRAVRTLSPRRKRVSYGSKSVTSKLGLDFKRRNLISCEGAR